MPKAMRKADRAISLEALFQCCVFLFSQAAIFSCLVRMRLAIFWAMTSVFMALGFEVFVFQDLPLFDEETMRVII